MFYVLLISYFLLTVNGTAIDIIEKDLNNSIEKIVLINNNLFVGTINSLHRLSSKTLKKNLFSLKLGPQFDTSYCRTCNDHRQIDYHFKTLLSITKRNHLVLCGTLHQGTCQLVDENFNLIINSSLPIVANDPMNSTIGLVIPEQNLIYFGVTYTNEGVSRWQIPNISGRSLNSTDFMKIVSSKDDETIYRDDLSLRFMPRQQTTFIIQYIYSFYTTNYIYFITNQPNDIDQTNIITKIVRFCRNSSNSIIRSYTEIPLVCLNSDWIIKSAQTIFDDNNQMILIGLYLKRDGSTGTNICSWKIQNDIDKTFLENYKNCYTIGVGQRGLNFIKPPEPCRKVDSWSTGMTNDNNVCPWIISDRLPYPVGGIIPIMGRLFYENSFESSSVLQLHPFGSSILFLQGLTNGTFKLGIFDFTLNINWKYSYQLSTQVPILSNILFDDRTASFFLAASSKIHRLSFAGDCASHLSCDECLSSSNNVFCGWCSTTERCTILNECPSNGWQQTINQCVHIVSVQPLNSSIDQIQWINLTLSKLPQLEHNEIYQCIFADRTMSASTQAIKLDYNRLSCPTPSIHFEKDNVHIQIGNESKVRLSVIKWPSNTSIATVSEFIFYDCSSYPSCELCRSQQGCQWCSDRCSSMCTEKTIKKCPSFDLIDNSNMFIEFGKSIDIPLKFYYTIKSSLECRLNETISGFIDQNNVCHISNIPELINENYQIIYLSIYENNISIGIPIKMFIYRCDLYDACDKCQTRLPCSWCQGRCVSKRDSLCSTYSPCTSLNIKDFSPKKLPLYGDTLVTIYLNEFITDEILEITLADVPCLIIKSTNRIECQSNKSNTSRQGSIKIHLKNSIILFSKEYIQYCHSSIISLNPMIVYEFGGQSLHVTGNNLMIGNQQKIFIGNFQCISKEQTMTNILTCRLPSILSGLYNVTIIIDNKTILNNDLFLKVTPNPVVQNINPIISFASGGRLVTVRGMYFTSAQLINVEFSYKKWSKMLKINSNEIISTNNGINSSFTFRTPGIPLPSNEFSSPPVDVDFSLDFDNIIRLSNFIKFHYIPDILLNISSKPPTLPYTGDELNLHVENLTDAVSMTDIQLFVGCAECKLKSFTSKRITCQPPTKLITNTHLVLHQQEGQVPCTLQNSSIGPIRFRIGSREYLIGYLSYMHSSSLSSSRYSVATIVYLSLASCLLIISLLSLGLFLNIKLRKSKEKTSSLSPIKCVETNDKAYWTTTSAIAGPYYQVYEQISSSSSSNQNTLARAPLIVCPYHHYHYHYKQEYSTLSLTEQLENKILHLTNLSMEHEQLKKLIFTSDNIYNFSNRRQSMELFYDLLGMTPFSEAFIDQLVVNNCNDLFKYYGYVFRYNPLNLKSFLPTREILFFKLVSTFLFHSTNNLYELFFVFDKLINSLIDLIDSGPCDQLLSRSVNSISSSTLLLFNVDYTRLDLLINYENLIRFQLPVLDCDTVDQIKVKIVHHLNSYETIFQEQIDLILPLSNICSCNNQIPTIKQYSINSTILCRKKSSWDNFSDKKENNLFAYHLCRETQLIKDKHLENEKLKANKKRLQKILNNFYEEILNGLKIFSIWENQIDEKIQKHLFRQYIQLVSDLIRRLHRIMVNRSTCPIIKSCLNVIADGLEFIFQTKYDFSSDIEMLFEDDKKYFSSFDIHRFKIPSCSLIDSLPSSLDIRSFILDDHTAIECLFKLYQFYELHSEPINQHIGENHVSVLLPVHHLLVQIRQLINSDSIQTTTTII